MSPVGLDALLAGLPGAADPDLLSKYPPADRTVQANSPGVGAAAPAQVSKWTLKSSPDGNAPASTTR